MSQMWSRVSAEQRARIAKRAREKRAEIKRKRVEEQRVIDAQLQVAFRVEQNITQTRSWWGKP